jgi:hypothetical protein
VRKCGFQQKAGNRFGVRTIYELAPEPSYLDNLVRKEVWLMIFSDWAWSSKRQNFQVSFAVSDKICPE